VIYSVMGCTFLGLYPHNVCMRVRMYLCKQLVVLDKPKHHRKSMHRETLIKITYKPSIATHICSLRSR